MSEDAGQRTSRTTAEGADSPLDPYVEQFVRWIAASPRGLPASGLSGAAASHFGWPPAFAECILASLHGRRFLSAAKSLRVTPSMRANDWLADRDRLTNQQLSTNRDQPLP